MIHELTFDSLLHHPGNVTDVILQMLNSEETEMHLIFSSFSRSVRLYECYRASQIAFQAVQVVD